MPRKDETSLPNNDNLRALFKSEGADPEVSSSMPSSPSLTFHKSTCYNIMSILLTPR